jgi:hypothetical protein
MSPIVPANRTMRADHRAASGGLCRSHPAAGAILDSARPSLYNPPFACGGSAVRGAQVAQLVEHVTENHGVGGSIPPLGTNEIKRLAQSGRSQNTARVSAR